MTQASDLQAIVMAVGEVKGQLRELVHGMNNLTQAGIHTSNEVSKLAQEIAKLAALPGELAALEIRIGALEVAETKRGAVMGLGGWVLSILPMSGVAAAVAALIEFLRGKH